MTKALIYCRVSSQRQATEGHGLDSQEGRCRAWAKDRGYEVVRVFADDGVSGALFDRPKIKELLAYLDSHATEKFAVIFDDLARFAREVSVHIRLKTEFGGRDAKLECLNFNFDDSPEGEFAELVIASSNQLQRKQNRRQVIQKMKARLVDGYWPFCMPPGLKNFKDPDRGRILRPDGSPNAIVRKAAIEMFVSGQLRTQDDVRLFVRDELVKLGIKSKLLSHHGVQSLLKNPLYFGLVEYKPWDIPLSKGKHEGLVSPDLYPIALSKFNSRLSKPVRKDYTNDFPLRGLVRCARCGGPFTGSWSTGRYGKKYPKYDCKELGCSMRWKTIHRDKLHEQFGLLLKGVTPAEGLVDLTIDVLNDVWSQYSASYAATSTARQEKIKELEAEIVAWSAKIGKTTDEALQAHYETILRDKLTEKGTLLTEPVSDRRYSAEELGTATKMVLGTLKDPVKMWQNEDGYKRRTIVLMYFDDKLRYDRETGFGTASLASPIKLMQDLAQQEIPDVEMGAVKPRVKKKPLNVYKRR